MLERRKNEMRTQLHIRAGRAPAIAMLVCAFAATACGSLKGTALAVDDGIILTSSRAGVTDAGGNYLTANEQYGVGATPGTGRTETNDLPICAPSGRTCFEP
jgi:hypothetical protein